ncbi:hypothetical protein [Priestia taiwanensis]|uniref:Uncharacterized protein n=1 Tax=Priestia taiwanensis TaxID=1347902 RepID=A0A917AMY9_9BACI|nr:hypothetical protein [Priestia taiwanensis]MBM7362073.1 hypothetical protein [Priestia taiwanensis]GGE59233.1 hypothetical protein GCM10007140_06960 [Priestia taiwanensis]
MATIRRAFKHVFLDVVAMCKGFAYGFVMVSLFILLMGALLYGILFVKNVVF